MTPQEFKGWFEGFTEALDKLPTKAQWARVKERVAEIDGKPLTERVYVDRYWPLYQRYYGLQGTAPTYWCSNTAGGLGVGAAGQASGGTMYLSAANSAPGGGTGGSKFDGATAMAAVGRAEAQSLAA